MEKITPFNLSSEEAAAWFSTRVILSPRQSMRFVVTWSLMAVGYFGLLILNWYTDGGRLWWYYSVFGLGMTYLAQRYYTAYRIAKIREKSNVPEWFEDMCLSYWVWARRQRVLARRQWWSDVTAHMGKGIGLDRRR